MFSSFRLRPLLLNSRFGDVALDERTDSVLEVKKILGCSSLV
jgi:hypothetical protein